MATIAPKLDLDDAVLEKAKQACLKQLREKALAEKMVPPEVVHFSETVAFALDKHLKQIEQLLEAAGFRRQKLERGGRPRRMAQEQWEKLGKLVDEKFDTTRITLVRAALALLAREAPTAEESSEPAQAPSAEPSATATTP